MRAGAVLIVMQGAAAAQFYILRKLVEAEWGRKGYNHKHAYIASLSAHTIVYKGQLMPSQARPGPTCRLSLAGWACAVCLTGAPADAMLVMASQGRASRRKQH